MDMTIGFSRLERPRNHLRRHSNCSRRMFYGGENGLGLSQSHCQWLLPFYTYPTNCLALYLLNSMVFITTVCQVYVLGRVGTEVQWLWLFKLRSSMLCRILMLYRIGMLCRIRMRKMLYRITMPYSITILCHINSH